MLKGSSHLGSYQVTRQDSSSEESEEEEETFLGYPGVVQEEEEEEDPPEELESASIDGDEDASPVDVSLNVGMNQVHPSPISASAEVNADSGDDIPLEVLNDSSAERRESTPPGSASTVTEETPLQAISTPQLEEAGVAAALPSYDKLIGRDLAPPDYDTVTSDEDARNAQSMLQVPPAASPTDRGPPMELSVITEDDDRPRSRDAWVSEEDGDRGDADNVANEDIEARGGDDSTDNVSVPAFIPDPLRPAFRQVRMFRPGVKTAITTVINFCIALFLLLMILSIQKLDYTQMGFKMKRVGHYVYFMEEVFEAGRYFIGPSNVFKPYSAIAHSMEFDDVRIYTTDPLRISFRCHFHFFLKKSELGILEEELDRYYLETIEKASISAIKNAASQFSVDEFLAERSRIESFIHLSLQNELEGTCCLTKSQCKDFASCHECYTASVGTNCNLGFHIEVPFFNMLMVSLPDTVLSRKQLILTTALGGEEEVFHQTAALTRKTTQRLVKDIRNEAAFVSANATAHASAIRVKANAQAKALVNEANSRGLTNMFKNLSITEEDHRASVHWLRTLRNHQNLVSGVDYEEYLKLTRGSR